ncbi:uncharacterized protein METZ01_LOCUS404414, partial [marine metagenome]
MIRRKRIGKYLNASSNPETLNICLDARDSRLRYLLLIYQLFAISGTHRTKVQNVYICLC